jgi:hypothetical protein
MYGTPSLPRSIPTCGACLRDQGCTSIRAARTIDHVVSTTDMPIRLLVKTPKRVRAAAVRRDTSICALVAKTINKVAGEDDAYEAAKRHALPGLDRGFRLGGRPLGRDVAPRR